MQDHTQDSRLRGLEASGSSSPVTSLASQPTSFSGMGSVALHLPTFPHIIENARRTSTRAITRQALLILRGHQAMTGALNLSALARRTGYHRRTVARALDFAVRVHVLERVEWEPLGSTDHPNQPGRPVRYKSLWKPTTSKRAPSPHTPLQRHTRTRVSSRPESVEVPPGQPAGYPGRNKPWPMQLRSLGHEGLGERTTTEKEQQRSEEKDRGVGPPVIADLILREAVANFLNHVTRIHRVRKRMDNRVRSRSPRRSRSVSSGFPWSSYLGPSPRVVTAGRVAPRDSDFDRTTGPELCYALDGPRTLVMSCASRTSDLSSAVRSSGCSGLRPHTVGCG